MSRTSAFPVHTLTEDQAVEELAEIFDSAPPEEDQLARIHWSQKNAGRAQQLELHITHLQKQVAPPPHLQPETAVASLPVPIKEKRPMAAKKTPKEKLAGLVDAYHVLVEKLQTDPTNRRYRDDASTCKSRMSTLEREFHLTRPELQPIPPIKMGRPAGSTQKAAPVPTSQESLDFAAKHCPEALLTLPGVTVVVDPATPNDQVIFQADGKELGRIVNLGQDQPKAGPGPYTLPTADDLRALLDIQFVHIDEAPVHEEVDHPAHYTQGAVECIDALQSALGDEAFVAYCRASAMKYLWRSGKKGPAETDLRKAAWYVTRALAVIATLGAEEGVA